jgi:phosphatidylserine decarboxylase
MQQADILLARGEEMGRFNMGSTVILLFAGQRVEWEDTLHSEQALRMGQALGALRGR